MPSDSWNSVEDMFKELDVEEFSFFASALASYRNALMKNGFTRREAIKLVERYSSFIYDMSIEEFMIQKRLEEEEAHFEDSDEDGDVDLLDDDDVE